VSVSDIFGVHAPFFEIIYRTAIVYVVIVIGLRVTGNRQLGQMTPFDLVLILLIANAVQNAMVGTDVSIFGGLTAAVTLLVLNRITGVVTDRIPKLRRAIEGEAVLLINNGALIEGHIRRAGLTDELVLQAIREHGFEDETKVHLAVLEIDGTISIVPSGTGTVRTRHRVRAVRPGGN
jgi:uncharacterized membrane protein YcaP (DUF421 family)